MNNAQLHVGEVWYSRIGAIEGERQIVAMYSNTVALSAPTDPRTEYYRWSEVEFLHLVRTPAKSRAA
jgi:hypothetical protein